VVVDTLHGLPVEDAYRWLEDKDAPETRKWVTEQMRYTQDLLARVPERERVVAALAKYSRTDTRSVPVSRGGRLFFTTRAADRQQPSIVMRASADGPDVVLVDPDTMSTDHTTSVALTAVSPDGRRLVYGIRKGGRDELELRLFDVDQRRDLPGGLPSARYFGVNFDKAQKGLYYGVWTATGSRVRYHRFGDAPEKDALVFGEGLGTTEIPSATVSENGRWLVIRVAVGSSGDDTRIYLKDLEKNGPIVTVADTLRSSLEVEMAGDRMVILTNWRAPNRRILVADPRAPKPQDWKEIVPESDSASIQGMSLAGGMVYVNLLKNVQSQLRAYTLEGTGGGSVPLPGIGSASGMAGQWSGREGYFSFSSFDRPPTIYRYDLTTGNATPWWRSSAPFPSDTYDVRQFSVRSTNGAKVPFFMVMRKGIALDGNNRVLMTGYGGFNVSVLPQWSPFVAAWLELGGVYVSCNLRGGSEFGEAWHRGGMLANKQQTFDDLLNITQWVLSRGFCYRSNLAITGGSNGGLLVGAAMTQRPDLFGAVVCRVPLLDMYRYHRFLVARFWVPEYGSSEDATQFDWIRGYSPYQRVKPGVKYPSVLFQTGDSDTRVDPLHARKMTALLQGLGGENPVLLHYDVNAGHAGGQSVDKSIEDNADILQFLRWRLNMVKVP
jgi:prolyl oligopeptidase